MKRYFTTLTSFIFLITLTNACCFIDPATRAQGLIQKGKYEDAIKLLEFQYKSKPNSIPIKSLLAQTYSDYGLALTRDENKPPRVKYPMAKEQLAMALALNPYLKDAKDMYEMIEKIQQSFAANKLE